MDLIGDNLNKIVKTFNQPMYKAPARSWNTRRDFELKNWFSGANYSRETIICLLVSPVWISIAPITQYGNLCAIPK